MDGHTDCIFDLLNFPSGGKDGNTIVPVNGNERQQAAAYTT